MLSYKVEPLMPNAHLFDDLQMEHWEELAKNKSVMVLKPHVNAYRQLEQAGKLVCIFVYDEDVIVGYSFNILTNHLHYADMVMSVNDILYLKKEYRNGSAGLRLITMTEDECLKAGSNMHMWHAKENTTFEKLLKRRGYGVQEIMLSKILKEL